MLPADFDDVAERITRSLITGDFDLYASVMGLPLRIEPRGGTVYELNSEAELREDFEIYCASIRAVGVTDIFRELNSIARLGEDRVRAYYRTHIFEHANRVVPEFESSMELIRDDKGWHVLVVHSSLGHINWTHGRGGLRDIDTGQSDSGPDFGPGKDKT